VPPADPVAARQIAADRERGTSASAALQRVLDRRGKRAAYRPLPPRRLRRAVLRLEPCLPLLSRRERRVLRVRAGLDGGRPLSVRRTARRLGLSRRRVVAIEGRSLAKLRLASAAGACDPGNGPAVAAASDATGLPGGGAVGFGPGSLLAQGMVLGARQRGAAEASLVGTSVNEVRDGASGASSTRGPSSALSLDGVGGGLGSRWLLMLLAGLGLFVAALARVRRRI
jgi:DNA-binding CsgD family transcriptional regulator